MVPEWVLDAEVSDRAVRLYCVLRRYARAADNEAWPKRATLAARMRCSIDSVDRALEELAILGAVEKRARYRNDGGRASNGYHVRWNRMGADTPAALVRQAPAAQDLQQELDPSSEREVAAPAEPPSQPQPQKARVRTPRDDIFDALVEAFGPASTKSRAAFYGRTVGELVGMATPATPEQVQRAAEAMRRRGWENPTPEALVKHWDALLAESRPANPASQRFWERDQ